MRAKRDYEYIRFLYENRGMELEEIAKKHELSLSYLKTKAKKENWQRQTDKTRQGCLKRLFDISDKLEDSIEQNLEGEVDVKNYKELTAAIKDALAIRRNLYRLPTQAEESSQRIALEKLDLERSRCAGEEKARVLSVEFSSPDYCE